LTVALDATYSVGRNLSGVGVYSREILLGLAAAAPGERYAWCYRPHRFWRGWKEARPSNVSVRLLVDGVLPLGVELFHGLNQRMPPQRFARSVVTFHDLFVLSAEYSSVEFRERFAAQAREAAARADLLICVSGFTASQVESFLGVERSRLRVVPHGVRFKLEREGIEREPVVLHVGAIQKRKNLTTLIEAFERAAPPPWRLCLAGASGYGAEEVFERIARSPARARIETPGWVDDEAVALLYARSSIFAFPSLDEGFGIPLLEAMACGLPVMTSNRASLPEVCGGAALLLEARDVEAWAAALRQWIEAPAERERWAALGRERAAQFSWQAAVEGTLRVYGELGLQPAGWNGGR
jgi:glycosyltransferase involved in cell wall biosynthesis